MEAERLIVQMPPQNIYALFDRNVPVCLVECIIDLLKYDPGLRLTSDECLHHRYLMETAHLNHPPGLPDTPPVTITYRSSVFNREFAQDEGYAFSFDHITSLLLPA